MPEISGGGARDTLAGTAGTDTLSGGDGGDSIFAGSGDDVLYGFGAADLQGAGGIAAVRVASGLVGPLFGVSPPGDPDRLFIVEQHSGRIMILDVNSGTVSNEPFLDLPNGALAPGGEQGLLGLAFHPNYQANGLFYIYLTNAAGDTEVQEYVRQSATRAGAQTDVILTIDRPSGNHVGGWIAFGPDGYLYIASGDGHSMESGVGMVAQGTDTLLGKILRIDVNGDDYPSDFFRNYAIPAGNPFAGATPGADEIWLYGLRNPWRPSFDTATGDLYIGDVGANSREEVDYVRAGQSGLNFGWPIKEGFSFFRGTSGEGLTDPILDYDRTTPLYRGFAITGGYVYHGPGGGQGLYVFADYVTGNLWTVRVQDGQAQDFLNRNGQITVQGGDLDGVTSFAVDGRGRLYAIGQDGDIHRLDFGAAAGDSGDYLRGEEGNDQLFGGVGFDDLNGNQGDDTASGGPGDDWVVGGKDQDVLRGDDGADIVFGNLGDDTSDGGAGNDLVRGGQGNDVLTGGAGDDFMSGDRGGDTLTGGGGADIFNSFGDAGLDLVLDFNRAEGDRVRLDPGSTYSVSQKGADTVVDIGGGARVVLVGVSLSSLGGDWIFVG